MNKHDIELPPLPPVDRCFEFDSHRMKASIDIPYWGEKSLEAYARAAIEADRQRRGEPVLVGWTVSTTGGGILHASKYTEYEAKRSGYSLPVYRLTSPQPAEPVLDAPAKVGAVRFGKGVPWSTVIEAAQRRYSYESTPEKEHERIKRASEFVKQVQPEAPQPAEPNGYVGVSLLDIKVWRNEWLEANDPRDGTDCVTPFDEYLYGQPAEPVKVPADQVTANLAGWLSAALEDPNTCQEMKDDILAWMEAGYPNARRAEGVNQ